MISEVIWVSVITSVTAIINTVINTRSTKKKIEKSESNILDKAASKADVQQLRASMTLAGIIVETESSAPVERRVESPTTGPMKRRRADDLPEERKHTDD